MNYHVRAQHKRFKGNVFSVVTDEVEMPGGDYVDRDYVRHIGAVAVAAVDEADRIVLVHQYRHPVGRELWELPAGLIDVAGEELPAAAARELAEEVDLAAEHWQLLLDLHSSPGFSTEVVRQIVDGDLCVLHIRARRDGEPVAAVVDIYRAEGDRIVEHWDVLQPWPGTSANDHPMFRHGMRTLLDAVPEMEAAGLAATGRRRSPWQPGSSPMSR